MKNQSTLDIHQELLKRCKEDDTKAQFEIYRLYYKSMYNSSLRIVGSSEIAEEIMQDSFLSAFKKIGTWREEVSFGAWLKKIVINNSLDYLRKKKVIFEELKENLPVIDEVEELEDLTIEEVKSAVSAMPDGYRAVLSLILFEGYDHQEVSKILGICNVSSRTQFSRARRKLQEILFSKRQEKLKEKIYE